MADASTAAPMQAALHLPHFHVTGQWLAPRLGAGCPPGLVHAAKLNRVAVQIATSIAAAFLQCFRAKRRWIGGDFWIIRQEQFLRFMVVSKPTGGDRGRRRQLSQGGSGW